MSYTPYTWSSGDTVTAARLNNIEQGVASSVLFLEEVTASAAKGAAKGGDIQADRLNKTYSEIAPFLLNSAIYLKLSAANGVVTVCPLVMFTNTGGYMVSFLYGGDVRTYSALSDDGPLILE